MSRYCPLCKQEKSDSDLFCADCKNKIEKDYEVFVPGNRLVAEEESSAGSVIAKQTETKETVEEFPVLSPKKKNRKKAVFGLLSVVVLSVVSFFIYMYFIRSSNLDRLAWDAAEKINTIGGYLAYMEQHPKGDYIDSAKEKLFQLKEKEASEWQKLRFSDNTAALRDFKTQFPQSPYISLLNTRLDSLSWVAALNDNTAESYSNYMLMAQSGEFSGDYFGEAEKRYDMLFQSYPVTQTDLDSIKLAIDGFFTALSAVDAANIGKHLALSVFRFFNVGGGSREKVVGELLVAGSKSALPSIKFAPDIQHIAYEKNMNNNFLCHIPLRKSYKSEKGQWKSVAGYIVHAELDRNFQIVSIYETKPFGNVP